MADFFALVTADDANVGLRHLRLERGIQEVLSHVFEDGASELLDEELDLVPYGSQTFQPDETEAWMIEGFGLPDHVSIALENPLGTPELGSHIEASELKGIVGSFPDFVAFQSLDRRRVLTPAGLNLLWTRDSYRRLETPVLQISTAVHAVHQDGRLIFKNDWWARRLFNLSEYYVEATNEDLQELIDRPDVVAENAEEVLEQANQWERKRIGLILQSELLDHYGPALIRETAAEYGVNIRTDRTGDVEKLVIPEDRRERRELLRFLEEDYYRGPLTDTTYLANSKRAVRAGG